jgi:hypothetical protein
MADVVRVIGQYALNANDPGLLDLAHQVRFGPGMVLFGAGLVLLAAGGILTGAWRPARGRLPVAGHGLVGPPRR